MENRNPYVKCPYNSAHLVPKLRLQHHMVKCRKRFPKDALICPYNATHVIEKVEFADHLKVCADMILVEAQKQSLNNHETIDVTKYFYDISFIESEVVEVDDSEEGSSLNGSDGSNSLDEESIRPPRFRGIDTNTPMRRPNPKCDGRPSAIQMKMKQVLNKSVQQEYVGMGRGKLHEFLRTC